jgi:hypothetical protein
MSKKVNNNGKEVIASVSTLISFIKSKIATDLIEGKNKNVFDLEEEQLRKVNYIVNASIDKSFNQGLSGVIKEIDKLK